MFGIRREQSIQHPKNVMPCILVQTEKPSCKTIATVALPSPVAFGILIMPMVMILETEPLFHARPKDRGRIRRGYTRVRLMHLIVCLVLKKIQVYMVMMIVLLVARAVSIKPSAHPAIPVLKVVDPANLELAPLVHIPAPARIPLRSVAIRVDHHLQRHTPALMLSTTAFVKRMRAPMVLSLAVPARVVRIVATRWGRLVREFVFLLALVVVRVPVLVPDL